MAARGTMISRFLRRAAKPGHVEVAARAVRLPAAGTLVSRRPDNLTGLGVEHRVEHLGHLLRDEPVEPGPGACAGQSVWCSRA